MRLPLLLALLPILGACAAKRAPEQAPPTGAEPPAPAPPPPTPPSSEPKADERMIEAPTGGGGAPGGAAEGAASPAKTTMHRRIGGEVKLADPKVNGLDGGLARRALEGKVDALKKCYERELLTSPSLSGEVDAKLSVEKDGKVNATASGIGNAALEACVAETFETLDLGRGRGQVVVRITFAPES